MARGQARGGSEVNRIIMTVIAVTVACFVMALLDGCAAIDLNVGRHGFGVGFHTGIGPEIRPLPGWGTPIAQHHIPGVRR